MKTPPGGGCPSALIWMVDAASTQQWILWVLWCGDGTTVHGYIASHVCFICLESEEFGGQVKVLGPFSCSLSYSWRVFLVWQGTLSYSWECHWVALTRCILSAIMCAVFFMTTIYNNMLLVAVFRVWCWRSWQACWLLTLTPSSTHGINWHNTRPYCPTLVHNLTDAPVLEWGWIYAAFLQHLSGFVETLKGGNLINVRVTSSFWTGTFWPPGLRITDLDLNNL